MFEALSFIFGASIGSFVGVIVDRLHVAPILNGRSKCLTCGHKLTWRELIPIVSFVIQRGKCKNCGVSYGPQHLITEFVYGVLFVLLYTFLLQDRAVTLATAGWCIYYTTLFVVSGVLVLYDWRHKVIPSEFLYAFMALGLFMLCVRVNDTHNVLEFAAPLLVALPFLFLYLVTRGKGVGFGDVMLFAGVGGLVGTAQGFVVFMFSVWMGAIVGIILQLVNRVHFTRKYALPFVPFIILSMFIVLFTDISMWTIIDLLS